ncbi:MAG: hypothetical protein KatS3mg010_1599 [Acidimicrobiia bacterium]|nr:MAG: hypothetical protein KatS3mg010_1599 [Acidimicrobiia bacterium]
MVAETSIRLARSSRSVPICPGRRPSGGTNSTGPASLPPSGIGSSAPDALPNAASTGEPVKRRSRPARQASAATAPSPRALSSAAPPTVARFTANESC